MIRRVLAWSAAIVGVLLVVVLGALVFGLRASLPTLDGEADLPGLERRVTVDRDEQGVATILASSEADAVRALGYVHAQDRFFQMDLARRAASGRLAEVIGSPGASSDVAARRVGLHRTADAVLAALPKRHARLLAAYTAGVNAGLASLGARPPEYIVLAARPEPWTERDSVLVVLQMTRGLSFWPFADRELAVMAGVLPQEVFGLLTPQTTRFDELLAGGTDHEPAPIPGPEVLDLRRELERMQAEEERGAERAARRRGASAQPGGGVDPITPGSNAMAVGATRTTDGRAILANDMHLGLIVPNTWYRARILWGRPDDPDRVDAVGLTLPGVPGIVSGSNGRIAWGFTNATGDFADAVVVHPVPDDPGRYRDPSAPDGARAFTERVERIAVRFAADREVIVRESVWGPVEEHGPTGLLHAVRWTGADASRTNLGVLDMARARTLEEGLDVAAGWRGPPQNVLVADDRGRIGWTVSGSLPVRDGRGSRELAIDPLAEGSPTGGVFDEASEVALTDKPRVVDPPSGRIVSANNRSLSRSDAAAIGRNTALGTRARRIAQLLDARDDHDERTLLAAQLDTLALAHPFYRRLLEGLADRSPEVGRLAAAAAESDDRADADAVGYLAVRTFRAQVHRLALGPFEEYVRERAGAPELSWRWLGSEETVRRLLDERPEHLLDPAFASWDGLLVEAAERAEARLAEEFPETGARTRWGDANRLKMGHPLGWVVGEWARPLWMGRAEQSGDGLVPRVARPSFGASERLIVSPGRESEGILHVPGGQSGHVLSRYFRKGHGAWLRGEPTPLLPGEPAHTLVLHPSAPGGR